MVRLSWDIIRWNFFGEKFVNKFKMDIFFNVILLVIIYFMYVL